MESKPTNIGNFVRVANRSNGSVQHGKPGKFGRHEHATFDVNMAINKSGHDKGQTRVNGFAISLHALNMAIFNPKGSPVDMPVWDVY